MAEKIPNLPKRKPFGVEFDRVCVPESVWVHSPFYARLKCESAKAITDVVRFQRLSRL